MYDSLRDEFLAQGSEWWLAQSEKVEPLQSEIDLILDPKVRSLVTFLLSKAELFWSVPVIDSSVPFYPEDEYEEGGLVLHTRRCVQAFMILESGYFSNDEKDAAIAALLLRNVAKAVWLDEDRSEFGFDPFFVYAVDSFASTALSQAQVDGHDLGLIIGIDGEVMSMIFRLIRTSMGSESLIPETFPSTELEKTVSYAVLIASMVKAVLYDIDFDEYIKKLKENVDES